MHVETSFVRNLGGLTRARISVRAGSGRREPYAEHARGGGVGPGHSTEEATEQWKATSGGGRGGKGPAQGEQPSGGRGPDTEPGSRVDPIGGCAPGDERVQTAHRLTFDPREEPGALAAHAGICAVGEEKSSFLPRPFWQAGRTQAVLERLQKIRHRRQQPTLDLAHVETGNQAENLLGCVLRLVHSVIAAK